MGKSAKFAKRPRKAAASDNPADPSSSKSKSKPTSSSSANASRPLKQSGALAALSKTSNNPIAKAQPQPKPKPAEKLGKNEISIDRPDYIDLLSGRKTFHRQVREKVLLKGVPSGTRVVSASGVAAAVKNAKKTVASGSHKAAGKRNREDGMDLS